MPGSSAAHPTIRHSSQPTYVPLHSRTISSLVCSANPRSGRSDTPHPCPDLVVRLNTIEWLGRLNKMISFRQWHGRFSNSPTSPKLAAVNSIGVYICPRSHSRSAPPHPPRAGCWLPRGLLTRPWLTAIFANVWQTSPNHALPGFVNSMLLNSIFASAPRNFPNGHPKPLPHHAPEALSAEAVPTSERQASSLNRCLVICIFANVSRISKSGP